MASGGSIIAQYRSAVNDNGNLGHKAHYLVVVGGWTNKVRETVRYVHDYETNGGGLACYKNGTFTFLVGAPNGGVQLVRAAAQ
jgi:uncharacterized protein YjlB